MGRSGYNYGMAEQSPTVESLLEPEEPRWVITILVLVAIALLPWVLWLTMTLPSRPSRPTRRPSVPGSW